MVGVAASSVLIAELAIITVGTYVTHSWDIMEPISYVMMLGNFTFTFGWFVAFIENPLMQNPVSWFKQKSIKK